MKKLMCCITAIVLAVSVMSFSACSCGAAVKLKDDKYLDSFTQITDVETPSWEQNDDKITIKWFVNDPSMSWPSYGYDLVSKTIEEKTGVKIEFRFAMNDTNEELSAMIGGSELPDVFTIQASMPQVSQLADQGYLWPLNTLMEKFAPSMKKTYLEQQKDVFNWFKRADGNTYGIPNYAYSDYYLEDEKLEPNGCVVVREDWFKEVTDAGIDMTTKSGFIEGCKFIKSRHNQAIPVQMDRFTSEAGAMGNKAILWLLEYFAVPYETESREFNYRLKDEGCKEVLLFLNELYRSSLIASTNLSANYSSIGRNIANGNVFVFFGTEQEYYPYFGTAYEDGYKYVPLIIRNDAGDDPVLESIAGMGYCLTMVTRAAKRPDIVIKLLDFLSSEDGQRLVQYGVEGVTWNWADETHKKIEYTQSYIDAVEANNIAQFGLGYCSFLTNYIYQESIRPEGTLGRRAANIYNSNMKRPLADYTHNYTAARLLIDAGDKNYNSYVNKNNNTERIWAQYLPEMIKATSAEGCISVYNSTIAAMEAAGLNDVIETMKKGYKNALEAVDYAYGWPLYDDNYVSPETGPNGNFSYWKDVKHESIA